MNKRKNKQSQPHAQQSFQELVASATLSKFGGYIDARIQEVGNALAQRQLQSLGRLVIRLTALEEILVETKELNVTKESLAERISAIEDRAEGLDEVPGEVKLGDRVRITVKTRTAEQTEYQGSSRLQVDNIGSGATLGKELETAVLGLTKGEEREVSFGKDGAMKASIRLDRLSRSLSPEPVKAEQEESQAEEQEEESNIVPAASVIEEVSANASAG